MRRIYVRELRPYSLRQMIIEFGVDEHRVRRIIEQLLIRGVVRYRKTSAPDGVDFSDEADAKPDELYVFDFVGMAIISDTVVVVYPKYFRDRRPSDAELKQLFRVLRSKPDRTSCVNLSGDGQQTADKLPVMLALLDSYAEYGEYSNYVDGWELNGGGAIDWNRTIANHLPFVDGGNPVYMEYETRRAFQDDSDFVARLHRAVLVECSRSLADSGIAELLTIDADEIPLSDEDVSDFGDVEALEWVLERERAVQFIDWKIAVLDLLARYLLNRSGDAERCEIKVLGTTSFYSLWESACKIAFGDRLGVKLGSLGMPISGSWKGSADKTLLGIIPHPKWERWHDGAYADPEEVDTLVPDTALMANVDGRRVFCIYDAKYYIPTLQGKMKKQPGLESVTKQFLYQSAYRSFIVEHGFDSVVNAFLVPTSGDEPQKLARVSFPEVMGRVDSPFSDYIVMWALPAQRVFDAYLRNEEVGFSMLEALCANEDAAAGADA